MLRGGGVLGRGDPEEGEPYAARFRALAPAVDLVGPMPYAEFQRMIDDPPGLRNYWTADYLDELSDAAIDVFARTRSGCRSPRRASRSCSRGAGRWRASRADETPMAQRDAAWVAHPFALWENADDDERHIGVGVAGSRRT